LNFAVISFSYLAIIKYSKKHAESAQPIRRVLLQITCILKELFKSKSKAFNHTKMDIKSYQATSCQAISGQQGCS
jgi:hypothetical protein